MCEGTLWGHLELRGTFKRNEKRSGRCHVYLVYAPKSGRVGQSVGALIEPCGACRRTGQVRLPVSPSGRAGGEGVADVALGLRWGQNL